MTLASKDSAKIPILAAVVVLCQGGTSSVTSEDVILFLNQQGHTFEPEAVRMNLMRYAKHGILSRDRQQRSDFTSPVFRYAPNGRTLSVLSRLKGVGSTISGSDLTPDRLLRLTEAGAVTAQGSKLDDVEAGLRRLRILMSETESDVETVQSQMKPLLGIPSLVKDLQWQVTILTTLMYQAQERWNSQGQAPPPMTFRAPEVGEVREMLAQEPLIKEGKVLTDGWGMPTYRTFVNKLRWDGRKWAPVSNGTREVKPRTPVRSEDWKTVVDELARLSGFSKDPAAEGENAESKKP